MKTWLRKHIPYIIFGLGWIAVLLLSILLPLRDVDQHILVFFTGSLVTVTAFYAWQTQQQAAASAEMAKEMRQLRYNAFRPTIMPECTKLVSFPGKRIITVALYNLGPGPALDVALTIFHTSLDSLQHEWREGRFPSGSFRQEQNLPVLGIDKEETRVQINYQTTTSLSDKMTFSIVVECKDVYDRVFRSGREFSVTKDASGNWITTPLAALSPHVVEHRLRSFHD